MTDLILEYGNNKFRYPKLELSDKEINFLKDISTLRRRQLSSYFTKGKNFTVKKSFFDGKEVPDVHRYNLVSIKDTITQLDEWTLQSPQNTVLTITDIPSHQSSCMNNDKPLNVSNYDSLQNTILVFLESPHDEEYDYKNNFNPIRPANGDTGFNFYKYFPIDVLPKIESTLNLSLDRELTYSICFINPVPFQTSLHFIHNQPIKDEIGTKSLRDKVWKALYPFCEYDFITRVKSCNPVIILNMCTGDHTNGRQQVGVKSNSLKYWVKLTIDAKVNYSLKCHVYHPSFWTANINAPNLCIPW